MPLLRFRRRARSAPSASPSDFLSRRQDIEVGTNPNRDNHDVASVGSITEQKAALRAQMRKLRKAIPQAKRRKAARDLARQFHQYRELRRARHIALYLAAGSELATAPLIAALLRRGVRVYAPRVVRAHALRFVRLHAHSRGLRHALGIHQPAPGRTRRLCQMDVLLLPLLAFDAKGQRLGQGGGYYDRALSRCGLRRPLRLGLAFAAQALATLPTEPWDAPLHGVLTENGLLRTRERL